MIKMTIEQLELSNQNDGTGSVTQIILEAEEGQRRHLMQFRRDTEEASASIDGIWTGEIFGPYGWEDTGTYVLEQGRILGGNDRHHSAGRYSFVDDCYRAEIAVRYHGQPRAIFGQRRGQFEILAIGTLKNGVIEAQIDCRERPGFSIPYRMVKRSRLP